MYSQYLKTRRKSWKDIGKIILNGTKRNENTGERRELQEVTEAAESVIKETDEQLKTRRTRIV